MTKQLRMILGCITLLALASCGSHTTKTATSAPSDKPETVQTSTPHSQATQVSTLEQEGIVMEITPVHARKEVIEKFGSDFLKKGFMPVRLKTTNESYPNAIAINPDDVSLISPEGEVIHIANLELVYDKVKKDYGSAVGLGILFGGIGAAAAAASVASDNNTLNDRLHNEAYKEKMLNTGESHEGYVYIAVPDELYILDNWKVVAKVNNPGHREFTFEKQMRGKTDYRGKRPLYMVKEELKHKAKQ